MSQEKWLHVENTHMLDQKGKMIFRAGPKQILILRKGNSLHAINNRCPHEGYPLSEGSLSEDCTLTCNWHNWKFDLNSGETLVGGDKLRHYPVREEEDGIWVDVQDPPQDAQIDKTLNNLQASFKRYEYARMARELARLKNRGGCYEDAARYVIWQNYDRFEYGFDHAFGAMNDWLCLSEEMAGSNHEEGALVAILETVSHVAWDTLRQDHYAFSEISRPYDSEAFLQAVESEDEEGAIALIRGAMVEGMTYADLEGDLARAALAHYNDFGHCIIYVYKCGQLIERLGARVTEPLILSLVRTLIYARREDLIPEFRAYQSHLQEWDGLGLAKVEAADFIGLSVNKALTRTLKSSAKREDLYDALYGALSWNMLHFHMKWDQATDKSIAQSVGWLDFTHGLTMSNAVRALCGRYPDLWPAGLLQMACFVGRNRAFVDKDLEEGPWHVADRQAFFEQQKTALLDHGLPEPIVSCHWLKLMFAVMEDVGDKPDAPWADMSMAALNRFLNSPLKRKHSLRNATQALQFVAREG